MNNICYIIGAGDIYTKSRIKAEADDYIICADGGYDYAVEADLIPDLLIGDFDSIKAIPENVAKITLPVEKDVTDAVAAFNEGVKQGFASFVLFGGTGGRFEHTFANISLMANASNQNLSFEIIDEKHIFRAVTNSSIKIERKENHVN